MGQWRRGRGSLEGKGGGRMIVLLDLVWVVSLLC